MIPNINLNHYKIFYATAKSGSISRAAEELFISQPAISKSICKLEEDMNIRLFNRTHKGVSLTDEGKILFSHLDKAFSEISIAEEHINKIHSLGIGQIKIGASTTLARYMLIPYLSIFVKHFPHIKIIIECQSSIRTAKLLDENKIDIALIIKPEAPHDFDFFAIGDVEYAFISTPSYISNLYKREDAHNLSAHELELKFFKTANLMLLDQENITRQYVDEYFRQNRIEISNVLEVSNMDLLIEFAKIGLGAGCVIKEFVADDILNGTVTQIPLINPIPPKKIGFAFKKNAPLSDSVKKFVDFYKST